MAKRQGVWDSGDTWDDPEVFWDGPPAEPLAPVLLPKHAFNLNLTTNMEYWEITLDRSQKTLPVWNQYLADLNIGTQGPDALEALIDGFEPLVQARVAAQDVADAAFRDVQASLLKMKILGTAVTSLIGGHLDDNEGIIKDVAEVSGVGPRSEATILKRARMLYPVWVRANAAMVALTPTQPPIARAIQGVPHTVAMLKALVDGYVDLIKVLGDKEELLDVARGALRAHDQLADRLNKRWYKTVKKGMELTPELESALENIPTEPSTPAPEPIEIATVTQGGENGLQALLAYVIGGGANATGKKVRFGVAGVDTGTPHEVPLDPSGNALGPFPVGTVLTILTEVSNSAGTRTSAPRTITIGEPIT